MPEALADLVSGRKVVVRGKVVPRDLLASPVDGEPCVYYNYSVEEWRHSQLAGLPEGFWRMTAHDEAIAEFYLQDETGRAIVAPQDVRIDRARGVHAQRIDLGYETRRASQLLIRPGDLIEVCAIADVVDDLYDDARDYRARARVVMLRAPEGEQTLIRVLPNRPVAVSESTAIAP